MNKLSVMQLGIFWILNSLYIAHELGHTVGLDHTDQNSGYHIDCTPSIGVDFRSVMKSVVVDIDDPGAFSRDYTNGDILGCQVLYPDDNTIVYSPN